MYTIGQISEMFNIPISTLRYYDKEGLFPEMERKSGIRRFSEKEVDAAVSAGVPTVSLGGRILRCETAPLYVLSCIGFTFGENLPEA